MKQIGKQIEMHRRLTLKPLSDLISIMDKTASYKIAFPTFLLDSVLVATFNQHEKLKGNRKIFTFQPIFKHQLLLIYHQIHWLRVYVI